jgi:hypothetical protein
MTLSEVLRTGRPYDPEGEEVIMSRQACENAAVLLEEKQRHRAEWAFIDNLICALRKIVDTAQEHPAKANFVAVHRQLIGEARALVDSVSNPEAK